MAFRAGSRLGTYEITGLLGEGGMGEVYRAVDSDLKREVAIKVLPDRVKHDQRRLARFQREAEILAALNHPHIAHVHGWLKTDDDVGLVMELVDGPTLADRIAAGQLSVDEALSIARQVALALETAHERGIVHRDLKPANIKVRPDGHVKVLDFGLAKLIDPDESGAQSENDSTITLPPLTHPGTVLGTPTYMAPEQAKGSPADRRADIWAFGCVLFEMLSGRKAFNAPSVAETLTAVMSADPDWSRLPGTVPAPVIALLRRCLLRDPRQRVSHIAVVLYALNEDAVAAPGTGPAPTRWTSPPVVVAALVAALAAGAAAAAIVRWVTSAPSPVSVVRTAIVEGTFTPEVDRTFAMTRDGTRLVFASPDGREIRVRSLDALDSVAALTTASYLRCLMTSPDGEWVGFVENNFTLKKIPIAGGASTTIVMADGPSRGASWGPDHAIAFATGSTTTGIQSVSVDGGPVTVFTRPNRDGGEADHVNPSWLPDGRGVLFTITAQRGGLDAAKVALLDLASGTTRILIPGAYGARYVNGGFLVYAAAGALWATRFDLGRLETLGSPGKVLPSLTVAALGGVAHYDIADNGTLVYPRGAREVATGTAALVWVDRAGRETAIDAPLDTYRHPRLSPDGSRLAVSLRGDIYLLDLARRSEPFRLTSTTSTDWYPLWTPDSRRIVFGSWRGGGFSNLYVQDVDGGTETRLTDSPDMQLPQGISPDGKTVIFNSFPKDLHAVRLQPPFDVKALVNSPSEERSAAVSPDGLWLAYEAETPARPGVLDIFVQSFEDPTRGTRQITNDGGMFPVWRRHGQQMELYYVKADGTLVAMPVKMNAATWRAGAAVDLFRGSYLMFGDGSMGRHFDVAPDGRILMIKEIRDPIAPPPHFVVVQDWLVEVRKILR